MSEIDPSLLADLLSQAMREGQLPFLTVVSNSMSPLIRRGDQIQIAPAAAERLQPGDIIVYKGPANLITHRYWGLLSENGQTRLITRGDRPQHFDKPFDAISLVGRVIGRRRKKQFLDFARGKGKWLNKHLANLARLEIRFFSKPPEITPGSQSQLHSPKSGGRLSNSQNNLLVRLIRRFLYSWAIILTIIVSVSAAAFTSNKED
jgi:hypothetical protein